LCGSSPARRDTATYGGTEEKKRCVFALYKSGRRLRWLGAEEVTAALRAMAQTAAGQLAGRGGGGGDLGSYLVDEDRGRALAAAAIASLQAVSGHLQLTTMAELREQRAQEEAAAAAAEEQARTADFRGRASALRAPLSLAAAAAVGSARPGPGAGGAAGLGGGPPSSRASSRGTAGSGVARRIGDAVRRSAALVGALSGFGDAAEIEAAAAAVVASGFRGAASDRDVDGEAADARRAAELAAAELDRSSSLQAQLRAQNRRRSLLRSAAEGEEAKVPATFRGIAQQMGLSTQAMKEEQRRLQR